MRKVNTVDRLTPDKAKKVLQQVTDACILGESFQDIWNALVTGGAMDILGDSPVIEEG